MARINSSSAAVGPTGGAASPQAELQPRPLPRGVSNHTLHSVSTPKGLARLRYQLLLGVLVTVVLPTIAYNIGDLSLIWRSDHSLNTAVGASFAFIIALYLFRRVISFPGVGIVGHALPALTGGYGIALAVLVGLAFDFSRVTFFASFVAASLFFYFVSSYVRRRKGQRFYLVPSESTGHMPLLPNVEWVLLAEAKLPADPAAVLIADLRADLGDQWERLISDAAVAGHAVYHVKQVQESLTGRVAIEHLSENSFGSLLPNSSYRKIKRISDLSAALIAFPLLLLPALVVALAIKLESPGPVFFRQSRRGYRGVTFQVLKFRTMTHLSEADLATKDHAITKSGDARITRVGRFLRRTRIDELPQIWNIIKGEMSWIGPRPEALPLSDWYTAELPFYSYRHIVRPGITGWAQVSQGHVAELDAVFEKLHYDFYYIKNFSAWLDLLILFRTVSTVFSGYGAK